MEPELNWEKIGTIPSVCFPTAARWEEGRELLIYYGGADRVVGLATADMDQLLDHLLSYVDLRARPNPALAPIPASGRQAGARSQTSRVISAPRGDDTA